MQLQPLEKDKAKTLFDKLPDMPNAPDIGGHQQNNPSAGIKKKPTKPGDIHEITINDIDNIKSLATEDYSTKEPLRVVRWHPAQEPAVDIYEIVVKFSSPMVPITTLAEESHVKVPVSVRPKLDDGVWVWNDPFTAKYYLESRAPLPRSTLFKLKVRKSTTDVFGNLLEGDHRHSVSTARLKLVSGHRSASATPYVLLRFSQRYNFDVRTT
jgi:hypothetical protein